MLYGIVFEKIKTYRRISFSETKRHEAVCTGMCAYKARVFSYRPFKLSSPSGPSDPRPLSRRMLGGSVRYPPLFHIGRSVIKPDRSIRDEAAPLPGP
ncbi:hypothetical protein B5X24_HaOG213043 [Helicoverpa armigera]|nr:hypothetical protein B5X24_HaOG213043 [Helicoverpa armigera]